MKLYLVANVITLLIVPLALAEVELKGSPTELAAYLTGLPRTVSVTGEGEIKAQADRAVITLRVSTEKKSLAEALRANEEVRSRLADFLKEHRVGLDQIRTSRFSSTPKYSAFSEKAKSHRVDNVIKVTARDEREFQTIAGATDKFAEVGYVEAEFEHSDKESLKAKAITQACDNANRRKKVFEEKLGLKLTPRRLSEGTFSPGLPAARIGVQGGSAPSPGGGSFGGVPARHEPLALDTRAEQISAFGELVFKVLVTVEFAVENK